MLRRLPASPAAPSARPSGTPPWRAQLDEIAAILAESAARPRLRAQVLHAVETEAGGSLPRAAVERLADRVAGLLAA